MHWMQKDAPVILTLENNMRNYSSKLLFQWNPIKNGKEYRKKRVCEERIYT